MDHFKTMSFGSTESQRTPETGSRGVEENPGAERGFAGRPAPLLKVLSVADDENQFRIHF